MPRVRKGPNGPKSSLAGKKGTNKRHRPKGAGTSGKSHVKDLIDKGTGGRY